MDIKHLSSLGTVAPLESWVALISCFKRYLHHGGLPIDLPMMSIFSRENQAPRAQSITFGNKFFTMV